MIKKVNLFIIIVLLTGFQVINAQEYVNLGVSKNTLSIREVRQNAISGNIGWNSLTGVGVTYHNYLAKQMGVQLGVGLSSTGIKFGGRFSYLFLDKNFSPFVSGGFNYGMGFGDTELEYDYDGSRFSYTIGSSPFAQIAVGIERISNGGFLFSVNIGYAILLKESNYEITKGNPSNDELRGMDIALGSGFAIEVTLGYAFKTGK